MAKVKVVENKFKAKSKSSLGRHAKKDSTSKGSKNYRKKNIGQGK
jgi:hypothetical protein